MGLSFNPPHDIVRDYLNRPNEGLQVVDQVSQLAQAYHQRKQQEALMNETIRGRKAAEFKAIADYIPADQIASVAAQYGINIPQPQAQLGPSGISPSVPVDASGTPIGGPVQGPSLPGVGMGVAAQQPPVSGAGAPSPLIARWQQFSAGPTTPDARGIPTSKAGMARYKTELETQKLQKELSAPPKGPLETLTKEQAIQSGTFDPTKQIIVEPPTANDKSVQDQKREDRIAKAVTDYGKQIENHPVIKALNNQQIGLEQVQEMTHLVDAGNTVASSAMGTKMARAMGEVGVLTETDIKRYVQSGKLTQGAADTLSKWTSGTPTNATMAEIKQIAGTLRDSFSGKIQPIYDRHIDRFSRAYKMDPKEAAHLLAIPYSGNQPKNENSPAGQAEVTRTTKDGKKAVFDSSTKQFLRYAE